MENLYTFLLALLSGIAVAAGQGASLCQDVNTGACSLFFANNPGICSDPAIAQTCQRFCGLCPLTCYDCPTAVNSSTDCNNTILCASDEVCMTKTHVGENGDKEFILSCEKKSTCDGLSLGFHTLVGKRDTNTHHRRDLSFQCCDADLCNYPTEFATTRTTIATTTTTVTTTQTIASNFLKGCAKDIVFVLDGSSSIGQTNHIYMRQFVQNVISGLHIGQNDSLVAVVEYSDTARVEWYLTDHSSLRDLVGATNTIPYVSGSTATHAALWLVRNAVLKPSHGDRPNAKNVVIILTDGGTNVPSLAITEAQLLHNDGVEIIPIGIGNNVDSKELDQIIQQNGQYFTVASFPTLKYIVASVKNLVCK